MVCAICLHNECATSALRAPVARGSEKGRGGRAWRRRRGEKNDAESRQAGDTSQRLARAKEHRRKGRGHERPEERRKGRKGGEGGRDGGDARDRVSRAAGRGGEAKRANGREQGARGREAARRPSKPMSRARWERKARAATPRLLLAHTSLRPSPCSSSSALGLVWCPSLAASAARSPPPSIGARASLSYETRPGVQGGG